MKREVIVLGGGIGGLSAAQELVERDFEVHIYELKKIPGGKSRTIPVPHSGTDGRPDLPGEHGFRFFPSFYVHLPDSMKRIPFGNHQSCFDNLVSVNDVGMAQYDKPLIELPLHEPHTPKSAWREFLQLVHLFIESYLGHGIPLTVDDIEFFASRLWQVVTSCEDRRLAQLERKSWWDFIGAADRSAAYQKFLAEGLSRSLVAAQPREASARTVGQIQVRLIFGVFSTSGTDRVLNGPTSQTLLQPWIDYLQSQGVTYQTQHAVSKINYADKVIQSVEIEDRAHPGTKQTVIGDWFIAALPVESLAPLITPEMEHQDPGLSLIPRLAQNVRWMNGIQFFLKESAPIVDGHVLYVDSPWAITSISEPQFWQYPITSYGDGNVQGLISVDISDWDTPGTFVKEPAKALLDHQLIADEVWQELKRSLNVGGHERLRDEMLHSFFLDTDIVDDLHSRPHRNINLEPLFINKPDTWRFRPPVYSDISNFFLASDYVQTQTDLACMEAANEAARRAVNALLGAAGSPAKHCELWPMAMPAIFEPWRAQDKQRFDRGEPWDERLLG